MIDPNELAQKTIRRNEIIKCISPPKTGLVPVGNTNRRRAQAIMPRDRMLASAGSSVAIMAMLSPASNFHSACFDQVVPVVPTIASTRLNGSKQANLERRFQHLADKWEKETGFLSSTAQKFSHKAYIDIERMGVAVVPFILKRLQKRSSSGHWLVLLNKLTGFRPEGTGKAERVACWIEYGHRHGMI